ncbi:hypothetical protein HanRHA438_Chr00c38g0856561 [Helianthus annuus]|nr:hypothetical protein HanRHA438_Chr00c38g0856561 [Helianthus annuus]
MCLNEGVTGDRRLKFSCKSSVIRWSAMEKTTEHGVVVKMEVTVVLWLQCDDRL